MEQLTSTAHFMRNCDVNDDVAIRIEAWSKSFADVKKKPNEFLSMKSNGNDDIYYLTIRKVFFSSAVIIVVTHVTIQRIYCNFQRPIICFQFCCWFEFHMKSSALKSTSDQNSQLARKTRQFCALYLCWMLFCILCSV